MNFIIPFFISLLAGLSTVLGSIFMWVKPNNKDNFISFSLSFSASVMLAISILDLIPSALPYFGSDIIKSIIIISIFFGLGVFFTNLINKLIKKKGQSSDNLYRLGVLSLIVLALHNFPEGILTFLSSYKDLRLGISICIAIALHNIPEGIGIAIPIYYATGSKKRGIIATILSGLSEPLGAILAFLIFRNYITEGIISIFLVLVAGIMSSLSINKIIPELDNYQNKKPIIIGFITGFLIVVITLLL